MNSSESKKIKYELISLATKNAARVVLMELLQPFENIILFCGKPRFLQWAKINDISYRSRTIGNSTWGVKIGDNAGDHLVFECQDEKSAQELRTRLLQDFKITTKLIGNEMSQLTIIGIDVEQLQIALLSSSMEAIIKTISKKDTQIRVTEAMKDFRNTLKGVYTPNCLFALPRIVSIPVKASKKPSLIPTQKI